MGKVHYDTVSNAINALRKEGYTVDFNIVGDHLAHGEEKIHLEDFSIVDVYRYEGDADPGDEAAVYAIASIGGLKGVLVTGYGSTSDEVSEAMLEKLKMK